MREYPRVIQTPIAGCLFLGCLFLGCVLSGCGSAPRPEPRTARGTRRPVPEAGDLEWRVILERNPGRRSVRATMERGGRILVGDHLYDRQGRFLHRVALDVPGGRTIINVAALLPDGMALAFRSVPPWGLFVGRPEEPPERALEVPSGAIQALHVDVERELVVSLEGERDVVVRRIADLAVVRRAQVTPGRPWPTLQRAVRMLSSSEQVAFLQAHPYCTAPCEWPGLSLEILDLETGRQRTVDEAAANVLAAAFSPRGDVAWVVFGGGRSVLLSLPSGELLREGPNLSVDFPVVSLSVARGGDRLLASDCESVRVLQWRGDAWATRYELPHPNPDPVGRGCEGGLPVMFGEDGHRALIGGRSLLVLEEVMAAPPRVAPVVTLRPPGGWAARARDTIRSLPPPLGLAGTPRHLAHFESESPAASVDVDALDPSEFAAFDGLQRWGEAVSAHQIDDPDVVVSVQVWEHDGRRAIQYVESVRGGCEPRDRYVRVAEVEGGLLRLELWLVPSVPEEARRRALQVFFDDVAGGSPPRPAWMPRRQHERSGGC